MTVAPKPPYTTPHTSHVTCLHTGLLLYLHMFGVKRENPQQRLMEQKVNKFAIEHLFRSFEISPTMEAGGEGTIFLLFFITGESADTGDEGFQAKSPRL